MLLFVLNAQVLSITKYTNTAVSAAAKKKSSHFSCASNISERFFIGGSVCRCLSWQAPKEDGWFMDLKLLGSVKTDCRPVGEVPVHLLSTAQNPQNCSLVHHSATSPYKYSHACVYPAVHVHVCVKLCEKMNFPTGINKVCPLLLLYIVL